MEHISSGAFTWFGGPRALSNAHVELIGLIRPMALDSSKGEIVVVACDALTGKLISEVIIDSDITYDDHNVPAVYSLTDKSFLVCHTYHHEVASVKLSTLLWDGSNLSITKREEALFPEKCTYVYIVRKDSKHLRIITRSINFNFSTLVYDLQDGSLSKPQLLFPWTIQDSDSNYSGRDGNRPYLIIRERPNGEGAIFALTNDHPRAYRNGIFAGYLEGDCIYDLDWNLKHRISEETSWNPFACLTIIQPAGQRSVPWIQDVREDELGRVAIAWSQREYSDSEFKSRDTTLNGFRYFVRVYEGGSVLSETILLSGSSLYNDERDYVGGIAINPQNIFHYVYSSNVENLMFDTRKRWRLWETRIDLRKSFTRLIADSNSIRPVFSEPSSTGNHSLYFLNGEYTSFFNTQTEVIKITYHRNGNCMPTRSGHHDLPFEVKPKSFMPSEEQLIFEEYLANSKSFFEFGSGGSTLLALSRGVNRISSVETDLALIHFVKSIYDYKEGNNPSKLEMIYVPVEQLGPWGYELSPTRSLTMLAQEYSQTFTRDYEADLVFIDGRFRVRTFIRVLQETIRPLTILWDDYTYRPKYRQVEEFIKPSMIVGRMGIFRVNGALKIPPKFVLDIDPL